MLSIKDLEKKRSFITSHSVKCNCGHSMFFKRDSMICSNCGSRVFKNEKAKFRYEMTKRLKRKEKENGI